MCYFFRQECGWPAFPPPPPQASLQAGCQTEHCCLFSTQRVPLQDLSFVGKWTWHMLFPLYPRCYFGGERAAPACDRTSLFEETRQEACCACAHGRALCAAHSGANSLCVGRVPPGGGWPQRWRLCNLWISTSQNIWLKGILGVGSHKVHRS